MHHPDPDSSSAGKMAHQNMYIASGSNTGVDGGTVVNNGHMPVDEYQPTPLTQSPSVLSSQAPQHPPHHLNLLSQSSQTVGAQMKKKSGFQITSVTSAQESVGTNNSIAEDTESYDDLDESHTEDLSSSEILDVSLSRANDPAGAERSSSEETLNNFHEVESPGAISPNQSSHSLMNQAAQLGTISNGTTHYHYLHHHHVTLRHHPQAMPPFVTPNSSSNIGVILENISGVSSGGNATSASAASSVMGTTAGGVYHSIGNVNVPSPNVFVRDTKGSAGGGGFLLSEISNIEGVTGSGAIGGNRSEQIHQDQTMNSTTVSAPSENPNAAVATTCGPALIVLPNRTPGGVVTQSGAAVTVMTVASVSFAQPQPFPTVTTSSRFRVVKLDSSSEPFKKGRWTCTDYHDKDAPVSAPSFSMSEVTALGMRAGESVQQYVPECFPSGAGKELNYYTDTVASGKVGRVQHSQDYVTSLQGFQTSLFNGLNMGVSHTETLIHKGLTQTTGAPSTPTSILQSVSLTGVQNPIGNPVFAVSQQQLTYAQAVASQAPGSNQGLFMVQQPSVTAPYGQSHQSLPQPGYDNGNMVGGQQQQPMISLPVEMRLQQTTSLQVNTFSVVPQMGAGGPGQQAKSKPFAVDCEQQQPLTTQGLLPSASQVASPAHPRNDPQSVSQIHNGVNSGMALYASLPAFTTQLEDAQRLLLQHQSALLGLPKLAEASSPAGAAFRQGAGNSSALTSTVLFKAIGGEDDGSSGASVVAIDNKIEQAMDLVKSHLMFAVREEVEVLKEQIKDLIDRNSQLEQENTLLKTLASPEQMAKFQSQMQTGSPPASAAATEPQNLGAPAQPASSPLHGTMP
ncbi:hypothetical protein NHX12_007834 [Muraenolepis orangiensis]|uniref:TSC22 domain family protein 1 n=1 Tax=Muraenolepis orangiensis TaxID=630683 RepID=A0A9Q0IA17_9TELE|nr:hypothetical protein NHX12_007834 [Muraenolepis orangiensis]